MTIQNTFSNVANGFWSVSTTVAKAVTSNKAFAVLNGLSESGVILAISAEIIKNGITPGLINVLLKEGLFDLFIHNLGLAANLKSNSNSLNKGAVLGHGLRATQIVYHLYNGSWNFPQGIEKGDLAVHIVCTIRNASNLMTENKEKQN